MGPTVGPTVGLGSTGTVEAVTSTHTLEHGSAGARLPAVVFDVSSLRFRFGPEKRTVSVLSETGQHLATVPATRGTSEADAAWMVLNEAQASGSVLLPDPEVTSGVAAPVELIEHRIVFYNPFTAHCSVSPPGGTPQAGPSSGVVLVGDPFAIPPAGRQCILRTSHDSASDGSSWWALMGTAGEILATEREITPVEISRTLSAYA